VNDGAVRIFQTFINHLLCLCVLQAAIAADSRRYNVFTFLEDEGVDEVITSSDHVTPEVGDTACDTKQEDDAADGGGEAEPLVAAADTSATGFVTSSPTKLSEDVADLEFKGRNQYITLPVTILCRQSEWQSDPLSLVNMPS